MTLVGTHFSHVGLGRPDPSIDLGDLQLDERSVCPDGDPATGGFFGACTREDP